MSAPVPAQPTIPVPEPGRIASRPERMSADEYEAIARPGAPEIQRPIPPDQRISRGQDDPECPHAIADGRLGPALTRILPSDRYHARGADRVRLLGRAGEPVPDL